VFLIAAVVALSVGALIALQALISPTVAFFGLVIGGVALGLSGTDMKKTATYALVAGFFAYFLGTIAFAAAASIGGGYPGERVVGEIAIGAFAGLLFGVVAGLWTAGGAVIGTLVLRRSRTQNGP